ncbi:MAG: hypothetical protein A2Z88_02310 [Omnitrophica WOR_2 bacterium GWA2_47_8]|nr:MAG: hypothetical protein A2Z88_02310 [Omnitrophica WOR_2 bacterium GWA2_47_8]
MKRTVFALGIMSIGMIALASGASAAAFKEGSWSMTMTIHADGMDEQMAQAQKDMENMSPEERAMMETMMGGMGMKMGAQGGGMVINRTQCMTNDNPVPKGDDQEDCQQTHTFRGNTLNFEVTCDDSHSTGQVTYKNDSMKGTINSTTTKNGKEEKSTLDISGKYVGPCDQVSPAGMSDQEFAMKQKALDLKKQELEIKKQEMELEQASQAKSPTPKNASDKINDVNNAVNTTNNVKNTFSGLKSLLGR